MTNHNAQTPAAACSRCGGWTSFGGMSQYAKLPLPSRWHGRTGCVCGGPKTFVFNWRGGGYNTVQAASKAEAKKKMAALEGNLQVGGVKLCAAQESLHEAKDGEVAALDRSWASSFD